MQEGLRSDGRDCGVVEGTERGRGLRSGRGDCGVIEGTVE